MGTIQSFQIVDFEPVREDVWIHHILTGFVRWSARVPVARKPPKSGKRDAADAFRLGRLEAECLAHSEKR